MTKMKIALAGNPNSGKTTMFNALTGANQYVGNWPGVTVEKVEGKVRGKDGVTVTDLPGIYSLSPYTPEEVVSRTYLLSDEPSAVLNIVDASNIERNLYLTTQLMELGKPVVIALNMIDVVNKKGDKINVEKLSSLLGCKVVETSALKGKGIDKACEKACLEAEKGNSFAVRPCFSADVEEVVSAVSELLPSEIKPVLRRWYAIKLLERDSAVLKSLSLHEQAALKIESIAAELEKKRDDDTESIITNERYNYISKIVSECVVKKSGGQVSLTDRIDRVVTNRFLALPIFAVVMWLVYFVSVTTVGTVFTDWANDGLFGDGWHLFTIGAGSYEEAAGEYAAASAVLDAFVTYAESTGTDTSAVLETLEAGEDETSSEEDAVLREKALVSFAAQFDDDLEVSYQVTDEETLDETTETATGSDLKTAVSVLSSYGLSEPDPADYGIWVPGIPVVIENGLDAIGCADWLKALILDGIVAGVGAVLGFVPQMLILFFFLAWLESCGYMSRIAFILDRVFRRFGLSGKSFIPVLVGTGCGVPGIMASRTIENQNDRRMTIMTTTFIPCGAKVPFIAMIAGAIFGGAGWVAPSAYFLGIGAILVSGIMLKKTKLFAGDPAPFIMELPSYHLPTVGNVLHSMWERGWSFIKKAGTIILLATILVWFLSYFGWTDGSFGMLEEDQMDSSILALIGNTIAWIFVPLGFGNWQATVASITGLIAKENIVGTLGILYNSDTATVYQNMGTAFTGITGFAFLAFNLLCAPCFAAIGAIKREMNDTKWFWRAIVYQCGFAYVVALIVNQLGMVITGTFVLNPLNVISLVFAVAFLVLIVYMVVRPAKKRV
ncbi:MAG: ferrous iron transporter B [Treponema porcinum]|uniref:ferrous iron transporter B n=1 Tax=Treponema porcinum TaxID=261392 RepID=UPI002354123E|nr:ferrous iron transporter B [Treponema porcinum]MCI6179498.1 ferrous iron transporter B [Treponema porcinum]MCI7546416.1 ferrous iron transporter B [Treponema porcinum]